MNAPEPEHIAISKSKGIKIDWKDGHHSDYELGYLRDECPCATCTEERANQSRKPGEPEKKAAALLPMYKEPPKPTEVKPVGRYALNISWNDGHASGIYSWDYLRELCQCEECKKIAEIARNRA